MRSKEKLKKIKTFTDLLEFLFFEKGLNVTDAVAELYTFLTGRQFEMSGLRNFGINGVNKKIEGFEGMVLRFDDTSSVGLKAIIFGGFSNPEAIENFVNSSFAHLRTIDQSSRDGIYTLEYEPMSPGNFSRLLIETRQNAIRNNRLNTDGNGIDGVSLIT